MSIEKVLRIRVRVEEVHVAVTCNVCGKKAKLEDGWPHGFHLMRLGGGYGDQFPGDMETFEIVTCEPCLRAWVGTFEDPDVSLGSGMYPLLITALHTETQLKMDIDGHLATKHGATVPQAAWTTEYEDPESAPAEGSLWEHFKGSKYMVLKVVWEWPSKTPLVLYRGLYGDSDCFLRPVTMFLEDATPGVPRFKHLSLEASCDSNTPAP